MDLSNRQNYDLISAIGESKIRQQSEITKKTVRKIDSADNRTERVRNSDVRTKSLGTAGAYLNGISALAVSSEKAVTGMTKVLSQKAAMGLTKPLPDDEDKDILDYLRHRQKCQELNTDLKLQLNRFYNGIQSFSVTISESNQKQSHYYLIKSDIEDVNNALPAQLSDVLPSLTEVSHMSDRELCELIALIMNTIHDDYLEVYQNVVEKQTSYWKLFTDFQTELGGLISTDSSGDVTVTGLKELRIKLKELTTKNKTDAKEIPAFLILYPTESGTYVSRAEAEKWAAELSLPSSCIIGTGGECIVVIDTSPVENILEATPFSGESDGWKGSTTEFQAWQTGYNAQAENIKTNTQTLTTKFSTANSTYDTIIKLLSSSIQTLFDCCKEALRF